MKRFEHTIHDHAAIRAGTARQIVRISRQFADTRIHVTKDGKTVRGDGLLRLMTLGARGGDRVAVTCDGISEMAAVTALQRYFWNHL